MRLVKFQDYRDFIERISEGVKRIIPDACFFLYGSSTTEDLVPGVSDVDGGIIFPRGPVTDKAAVRKLSEVLKPTELKIDTDINLLTAGDGYFISYGKSYTDWIKDKGVVIAGPDLRQTLNGLESRTQELSSVAMNMRTIRNILLSVEENKYKEKEMRGNLQYDLERATKKLVSLPKTLYQIHSGDIRPRGTEALIICKNLFETIPKGLDWSCYVRGKEERMIREVRIITPEKAITRLEDVVTAYEEIIKRFMEKYPYKILKK